MDKVEEFFHYISPKIISLTTERFENTKQIKYKDDEYSSNFATEGDFDNEELIKKELAKWFPKDKVVAEETLSDTSQVNKGRNWIIDPICGSANFKNGIQLFCTNIALAENGTLIASCVIDHSRGNYIWSTGDSVIYVNKDVVKPEKRTMGTVIEVDLSALVGTAVETIERQEKLISYLLRNKKYYLSAFSTSLSFVYVALGQIDAYANGFGNVWDLAAANYLIMQAGGIVTQMDGEPWTLLSDNSLAARDKVLHQELLAIINSK